MFKNLFGKKEETVVDHGKNAPEIMGLRLGGAFELDDLKMRLIEPQLIIEGAARTQFIQAVGRIELDSDTVALRFYTDDDGYLQVLLSGGMDESNIADVKLWYFYETKGVASRNEWNHLVDKVLSQPTVNVDDVEFSRVWEGVGEDSPPVAMTEKTYTKDHKPTETDQFMMLYEREIEPDRFEYASYIGEEKFVDGQPDRCLVIATGFDIEPADITIT